MFKRIIACILLVTCLMGELSSVGMAAPAAEMDESAVVDSANDATMLTNSENRSEPEDVFAGDASEPVTEERTEEHLERAAEDTAESAEQSVVLQENAEDQQAVELMEKSPERDEAAEEDFEVELTDFKVGNFYETNKDNVQQWSKPGSSDTVKNSEKKGQIKKKGTVVKIVETAKNKTSVFTWTDWGKTDSGVWIWDGNLDSHKHTGPSPTEKITGYKSDGNKGHVAVIKVGAVECTKCANSGYVSVIEQSYNKTGKIQEHSWNNVGTCKTCGYTYSYVTSDVNREKQQYIVTEGVKLRSQPYDAAKELQYVGKGTIITVDKLTKENARGNKWYHTTSYGGGWIWSGRAEYHPHDYDSYDGLCSCGKEYPYETDHMDATQYETTTKDIPVKARPYDGATTTWTIQNKGTVLRINGETYPDPNPWWPSKGECWYRLEAGGWIPANNAKVHGHNYESGICSNPGCGAEYQLKTTYYNTVRCYETVEDSVVLRIRPWSGRTVMQTVAPKGSVIRLKGEVDNGVNGHIWYLAENDYWVYEERVKPHEHKLKVGVCTSSGCGYRVDYQTKSIAEELYVPAKNTVTFRAQPFGDASVVYTCSDKNTAFTINCVTTNLSEQWYRTWDGKWIQSSQLTKHKHTFTSGVCTGCGTDAPYQITYLQATVFETTGTEVPIWSKPYSGTQKVRTVKDKGTKLVIVAEADNYYNHKWYRLADGNWVYSGNVKLAKGSSVKETNVATVENYLLTVKNTENKPVANAKVLYGGSEYETNSNGVAVMVYVTTVDTLEITAADYTPYTREEYSMDKSRRDQVCIAQKGAYKATRVLLTHNGKTNNVLTEAKTLNQKVTNLKDFTLSCEMGSVSVGKYVLRQGSKTYESTDGTFKGLNAKSFSKGKTIYLDIYDTSGKKCAEQLLLINIISEAGGAVPDSFKIGNGAMSVTFSKDSDIVPGFLKGMELSIPLPKGTPVVYSVGDESIQIGLNFSEDIFEEPKVWKRLKELKDDGFSAFYEKYNSKKVSTGGKKDNPLVPEVKVGGYLERTFNGTELTGKFFVELEWKTGYKEYPLPLPVPVPPLVWGWSLKGKVTPSGEITITDWTRISGSIDTSASVEITGGLGIGVANVASASLYGALELEADFEIIPDPMLEKLALNGSLGVKVVALTFEVFDGRLWDFLNLTFMEDGVWVLEYDETTQSYDNLVFVPMSRDYLDGRSEWNPKDDDEVSLMEDGAIQGDEEVGVVVTDYDFDILQSNTYTDIRPQVVAADGSILMLYVDDNAQRADMDRTMLVYSVYTPGNNSWSEPKPVCDDATADFGFYVTEANGKIYVVWQNAKQTFAGDETIYDVAKTVELSVATYDPVIDAFTYVETITDNDKYEIMPRMSVLDGDVLVSWLTNSEDDLFAYSGTNTVHYAYKKETEYAPDPGYFVDEENFGNKGTEMTEEEAELENLPEDFAPAEWEEEVFVPTPWAFAQVEEGQPWITSLAVGYLDETGYIAFTTDEDGSSMTVDDQNILLVDTTTNELIHYTNQAMQVEFTKVHGDRAMTWYNQGYIYYALDADSAPQMLYSDTAIAADEYHIISDELGNMAILYAPKLDGRSNATVILYSDETYEWSLPVAVTDQSEYIQNFNGTYYDGAIVSVFNQASVNTDTLYTVNNLCTAVIGERHDLAVTALHFSDVNLIPGEERELLVEISNNGTVRASNIKLTLYKDDKVLQEKLLDDEIRPGDTVTVQTTITIPEEIMAETYRVCVEEGDFVDGRGDDNTADFVMGRPSLNISAEASPTEDENIVIITVENRGYDACGGSIILYDQEGAVAAVLLENFQPLEHGESVDCAIAVGDEYFRDAPFASLVVGVIPNGEQDSDAYCTTTVVVRQLACDAETTVMVSETSFGSSHDEISLLESTAQSLTAVVHNNTEDDIVSGQLYVAAYDSRGIFLDAYVQEVTVGSYEELEFTAEFFVEQPVRRVRIMLMEAGSFVPVIDSSMIELVAENGTDSVSDTSDRYDDITDVPDGEEF